RVEGKARFSKRGLQAPTDGWAQLVIDRQRVREIVGRGRHTHGWKRGAKDPGAFVLQVSWTARLKQPNSLSLRKVAHMPRVEDQGDIGSCTANGTTDALEFL